MCDFIPDQHMLDIEKDTPMYPFALAFYLFFWGTVLLFCTAVFLLFSGISVTFLYHGFMSGDWGMMCRSLFFLLFVTIGGIWLGTKTCPKSSHSGEE
ncbi:MAG: hypothetical protein LBT46_08945 [Planctomycetaceae bacterium]|jgi:hypothetical protein|nr:hypothetical protein [Planctomycetaceae bacterium]